MKTLQTFFLILWTLVLAAQQNPVHIQADDKLEIYNDADTSHLFINSDGHPSFIDFQSDIKSSLRFLESGTSQAEVLWSGSSLDLFSMPLVTFPQLRTPTIRMTQDRNVGIRKGLLNPTEALDVGGRIKVGYSEGFASDGVVRYNPDERRFEGFNGANWKSFGSLSLDDDGDSGIDLKEGTVDSIIFRVNGNEEMHFGGHSLEFGKDGNTYIGKGVTPIDDPLNIGNTVTGWLSARSLKSGVSNTIYGFRSSEELNTGDFNTIVGSETANKLTFGSRNTYLGYRAGWNAGAGNSSNVFLGYRAGEGFVGSNRLVIANSETTTPLIDGDFSSNSLIINGSTELKGNSSITGQVDISGATSISNQLTSQDVKIDDSNPFLEFKQLGNSQLYIQYLNSNDELVVVETGVGTVMKFSDGEIYLPTLSSQAGKVMKLDNQGKVVFEEEPINPSLTYYGTELRLATSSLVTLDLTKDFIANNKTSITQFDVRINWSSLIDPGEIVIARRDRITGVGETVAEIDPPSGIYNNVFTTNINHTVDTNNYQYFISTQLAFGAVIEMEIH